MSSAYKTSKAELVAIYRLEFYKHKKNWKFCQDVLKGKDSKEKETKETKTAKKSAAEIEKTAKKLLNETYVVDQPASGIDEALLGSDSDTELAKKPAAQTKEEPKAQTKEEPKAWINSSRNIALTSILQSEASKELDLPPIPDANAQDVTDGPMWSQPKDEPRKWIQDVKDMQTMKAWSEELEWQESGKQQVFQPELWSPTRESPLCFAGDKVWSKEDQIWPQSRESWPEPVLWRDNALVWPAGQQAQTADDTETTWPAATHQQKPVGETELLWAAVSRLSQKVGSAKQAWSDDSQQVRPGGLPQWPPDSKAGGERWEALREWIEGAPQELDTEALSPEVLVTTAEEWLHEPLADPDDWLDNCSHACLSRSMCEFMRGAHCREHSSEIELNCTREPQPPRPPAALSHAALCACVRRHAATLRALLSEARVRDQLSAELEDFVHRPHKSSSYEEFPTRDVGLQGPCAAPAHKPPLQGHNQDNFVSGSFLNDPHFDLESTASSVPRLGSDKGQRLGRGRGRLVKDDRVIGIGPGGRPYRL